MTDDQGFPMTPPPLLDDDAYRAHRATTDYLLAVAAAHGIGRAGRRLAVALVNHADAGTSPTTSELAAELGYSLGTVKTARRRLLAAGLIAVKWVPPGRYAYRLVSPP